MLFELQKRMSSFSNLENNKHIGVPPCEGIMNFIMYAWTPYHDNMRTLTNPQSLHKKYSK